MIANAARLRAYLILLLVVWANCTGFASAQIRILAGGPPGGFEDLTARVLAKQLPGAQVENMQTEPASAFQLLLSFNSPRVFVLTRQAMVYGALDSDPSLLDKVQGVSMIARMGMAVVVGSRSAIGDIEGLMKAARAQRLKFGTTAMGAVEELCMRQVLGHGVPADYPVYKGIVPLIDALIDGSADAACVPLSQLVVKQHLPAQRLKALAVIPPNATLANVPTAQALGLKDAMPNWYMLVALKPADPRSLEPVLNALRIPSILQPLRAFGLEPVQPDEVSPEAAEAFLRKEIERITTLSNSSR